VPEPLARGRREDTAAARARAAGRLAGGSGWLHGGVGGWPAARVAGRWRGGCPAARVKPDGAERDGGAGGWGSSTGGGAARGLEVLLSSDNGN
jgi:hypothetical protein